MGMVMKEKRSTISSITLFILTLGLIVSLLTYFFIKNRPENQGINSREERNEKKKSLTVNTPKALKKSKSSLPKALYIPPETLIEGPKLYFEALKQEIKALKKEKKDEEKPIYHEKEKNHEKVFLSLSRRK